MKKFVITLMLIICTLTMTACSTPDTALHRNWLSSDAPYLHETLVYEVTTTAGTGTGIGEYVTKASNITVTDFSASLIDSLLTLKTVDADQKSVAPLSGEARTALVQTLDEKGGYLLTTTLTFDGADGVDYMESELILDANYHPLFVYKKLSIGAEDAAGFNSSKGYVSYEYSAVYTYNASSTLQSYSANVLRRKTATEWEGFTTTITEFNSTLVWDANQVVYLIRSLNMAQDSLSYTYTEPAPLDSSLAPEFTATFMKQMGVTIASATKDVTPKYGDTTAISCKTANLGLTNLSVQGKTGVIYYADAPIECTFSGMEVELTYVPVKIEQGDYVFLLDDIILE